MESPSLQAEAPFPWGDLATGSRFWRPLNSTDLLERKRLAQGSQVSICLKLSLQAKSEIPCC